MRVATGAYAASMGYTGHMTESQPQHGAGKTAGLPGDNADPRNSEIPDDQLRDTVSGAGVAPLPDPDDPQTAPS